MLLLELLTAALFVCFQRIKFNDHHFCISLTLNFFNIIVKDDERYIEQMRIFFWQNIKLTWYQNLYEKYRYSGSRNIVDCCKRQTFSLILMTFKLYCHGYIYMIYCNNWLFLHWERSSKHFELKASQAVGFSFHN